MQYQEDGLRKQVAKGDRDTKKLSDPFQRPAKMLSLCFLISRP